MFIDRCTMLVYINNIHILHTIICISLLPRPLSNEQVAHVLDNDGLTDNELNGNGTCVARGQVPSMPIQEYVVKHAQNSLRYI
jgi:hypothetical protein